MEGLVPLSALKKIKPFLYEIPREYRRDMRVPARVFANQAILDQIKTDRSLTQLVNTATLPGTVLSAIAMPDIHQGYGFPIGGVVATNLEEGVISPGGVGYDINCGVRVILTPWKKEDVQPHLETILHAMFREIPSGFGRGYGKKLSRQEIDQILTHGAQQLIEWDFWAARRYRSYGIRGQDPRGQCRGRIRPGQRTRSGSSGFVGFRKSFS